MLDTLHIQNIGIIGDLEINFSDKLNVLTGETGAGKSLIINAIGFLKGNRFTKELIRKGENSCSVEALFFDISTKEENIVSRQIFLNGKNICKINGKLVTVNELKEFTNNLIEIHGQLDNNEILDKSSHIKFLDKFANTKILELKNEYEKVYIKYLEVLRNLKKNYGNEIEKQRKIELLKYVIDEIDNASLKEDEYEQLQEKRKLMQNSKQIVKSLSDAASCLSTVQSNINTALKSIEKISSFSENYLKIENFLQSSSYDFDEILIDVKNEQSNFSYNDYLFDSIDDRIELINTLRRKYGNTIEQILDYRENSEKELEEIENLEEYILKLKKEKEQLEKILLEIGTKMSNIRCEVSKVFENEINSNLAKLEMKNAKIKINIHQVDFNEDGIDDVCLYIKTNQGEDFKELIKIASGGEMSRVMLALKSLIAFKENVKTIIFDEVDTGISGKAASSVALMLSELGNNVQVICISHLPNIAAVADSNYYISKKEIDGRTFSQIQKLEGNEVLNEISRISTGEITDVSLDYAKELRKIKGKSK